MPRFVVQEHDAIRAGLHYDFRLEDSNCEGNFPSWVVPKLANRQRCCLAIKVADHNEHCSYFEGTYEEGYGAGDVEIWDQGTYEIESETLHSKTIILNGEKLQGKYRLQRKMIGQGGSRRPHKDHWFLIEC